MISIDELNEVKNIRKTNLYYEEKEYLQYVFLNSLSKFADDFVFKGGTCLRVCYGLERASEDLDFSTRINAKKTKNIVKECLRHFELLNINYDVYSEKEHEGNLRIEVRFEGPLFNGNKASTNTLKIDFNKQHVKNRIAKVIPQLFSDVPTFTLLTLSEEEMLTEKIRALAKRGEARDLYDIWVLLNKGVGLDRKLLDEKLKEEGCSLKEIKLPSKEEYELSLKNLLTYLPPYEQVKNLKNMGIIT
ncbi:nucleotidyl transferase AbiEii/AbiGii toxin family protein [Candidatus Woesearchaeota archaeon]|nr:nucleotidyl transferase AbiEii/AbiGii toxin family protein [Candidatus Woesearchaeota archaeon]